MHEPPRPAPLSAAPPAPGRRTSAARAYMVALLGLLVALGLQLTLWSVMSASPFLFFFGAVMLAGWWGGWGPALVTTALTVVVVNYYFLPPFHTFYVSPGHAVSLVLFTALALFMTMLNVALRRTGAEHAALLERERAARAEIETERARLQALAGELQRSEERYRTFLSQSTEGIYRMEAREPIPVTLPEDAQIDAIFQTGVVAECNDAMARMYGFEHAAALLGVRTDQLLVRSDPRNTEYLRAFIRGGYRIEDTESLEVDREGRQRVFLNNMVGFVAEGRLMGVWGTQRDVTEQRRAEEALRRAEARTRFLSEATASLADSLEHEDTLRKVARLAVPVLADWCVVDLALPDGRLARVEVAHAHPEEAALARELKRFGPLPEGNPQHPPSRIFQERKPVLIEELTPETIRLKTHNAEHARVMLDIGITSFIGVPLLARGRILGALSFFKVRASQRYTPDDVGFAEEFARRVAPFLDNARLFQEAREAIRVRDEFLSVASHELKTPLTPLSLRLQALAKETERQPDSPYVARVRTSVEVGRKQVTKLSVLIGDLLDVSRIVAGRLLLEWTDVDFAAIVRDVAARYEAQAARAGSPLWVDIPGTVPGRSDALRLEQVVTNLIDNAIKYGAGKSVHLRMTEEAGSVCIVVQDQGIGIAPEHLSRIFGRFERAVSERNYGGLGLGLYITKTLVEAMHGDIRVESTPGQGATFTVKLPLREDAAGAR